MPLKAEHHNALTGGHILTRCTKVEQLSDSAAIFNPGWHHMASAVITSHTIYCFTAVSSTLFLHRRNSTGQSAHIIRLQHAVNVAQQSECMRILCSNEQSKLCFGPTKSLLSDRNRLALPHGRGNFSKVGIPAEKTGNENFKGNETRHRKKNGKKTQE